MQPRAELPMGALFTVAPVARAALAQLVAFLAVLGLGAAASPGLAGQALLAAGLGCLLRLPRWWIPVNLAFAPAVVMACAWPIPPAGYLGGFVALASVYGISPWPRAPLYLSGINACRALSALLPTTGGFRFLDAGCGIGTTLAWLSPRHLAGSFEGVELAALPAILAWLRARLSGGLFRVHRTDLWSLNFADYDVVYAYLSPLPMNALLGKARREMRPGTLLVSHTFLPDGAQPDLSVPLPGRGRVLHAWRI